MDQLGHQEAAVDVPASLLASSPRGLHTSLEGGLDDVDLLGILQMASISSEEKTGEAEGDRGRIGNVNGTWKDFCQVHNKA